MVGGRDPGALAEYAAAMTGGLRVRGKAAVWLRASWGRTRRCSWRGKRQTWLDVFTAFRKRVGRQTGEGLGGQLACVSGAVSRTRARAHRPRANESATIMPSPCGPLAPPSTAASSTDRRHASISFFYFPKTALHPTQHPSLSPARHSNHALPPRPQRTRHQAIVRPSPHHATRPRLTIVQLGPSLRT
jgi:hypothetical protein